MRRELGAFLRGKRTALGLRREAVSDAAGIGYDWYVRVEQGRGHASVDVLRRLAAVLHLDPPEVDYVLTLARGAPTVGPASDRTVPEAVLRVMHGQLPAPAYVLDSALDLLAWNAACCAFYGVDWSTVPDSDRNILWLMLTDEVLRNRIVDWEDQARRLVSRCRALWAGREADPRIVSRVELLSGRCPEFIAWWSTPVPEVLDMDPVVKTIIDHEFGPLTVEQTAWLFGTRSDRILILSTPLEDDGATRAGLDGLLARG